MGANIPFFYYDISARLMPGVLVIALAQLVRLPYPESWSHLPQGLSQGGTVQAVLLPLLYGGVAYAIGLVLDVSLSRFLRPVFRSGFERALVGYSWLTPAANSARPSPTIDQLSKWSFDLYLVKTTLEVKEELPHTIRFHAEAKLFFHSAFAVAIVVLGAGVGTVLSLELVPDLQRSWTWPLTGAVIVIGCCCGARARARRRADQILSFIDHFGGVKQDQQLSRLRSRLEAFQASHRPPKPLGPARSTGEAQ